MNIFKHTGAALLAAFLAGTSAHPAAPQTVFQQTLRIDRGFDGLLRHDGTVFNASQLAGKPTLVFFGFTSCSTICPVALNTMTLAAEELERRYGKPAVPNLILVTTAPEHEGTDQLKAYLANFHPGFVGLAAQKGAFSSAPDVQGRVQQIESVLNTFGAERVGHHSPFAYLMNGQGRFIGKPLRTQDTPERLAEEIAALLDLKTDLAATPSP